MNKPEPTRRKLNPETPTHKSVNRIPMPPLKYEDQYDVGMKDDIYMPDNDSVYVPVKKKD
jgi:hypothetical protein